MSRATHIIIMLGTILLMGLIPLCAMAESTFVVVIDPGHGGEDYGAKGDKAAEKDIVLAVGKLLGQKISSAFPKENVKVVYTRDTDHFVTLQGRADIANKAKGNLFISIHANSVDKRNRNRRSINGASVYTLGVDRTEKNLVVAQRENSVMVLERDYTTRYQGFDPNSAESYIIFEMEQNRHMEQSLGFASMAQRELINTAGRANRKVRQAGFWVLHATSMPAVLVELDFICNPTEEKFMTSSAGQEKLATALFNAFCSYKTAYDTSGGNVTSGYSPSDLEDIFDTSVETEESVSVPTTQESPQATATQQSEGEPVTFCIQFATSKKLLKEGSRELKGVKNVEYYYEKGLYKYISGRFASMAEAKTALKNIKSIFPDAFIIKMRGNTKIK